MPRGIGRQGVKKVKNKLNMPTCLQHQKENEDLQKLITEYSEEAIRLKSLIREQEKLCSQAREKMNDLCYQVNFYKTKYEENKPC